LLHQVVISLYIMIKTHGQTTLKSINIAFNMRRSIPFTVLNP